MKEIFLNIQNDRKSDKVRALCIVVKTKGSTPRKAGAKMLVYSDGSIEGTIGGGELERAVIKNALSVITEKKPMLYRHDLLHQHSMCCGGWLDIYIEPLMEKSKLYIFGAGHTGQALAGLAVNFSFDVFLIDERREYINNCKLQEVNKLNTTYSDALQILPFSDSVFICIMTHSHAIDREILAFCLKKPNAYLGMIGSKRKVEMTKKMFAEGLKMEKESIGRVDMPMGINIGAEGPMEIAVSILAKLIETKNMVNAWEKEFQL